MNKKHTKNAYVLVITIIVTFVLVITVITILSVVYRYSNTISKDMSSLREIVKNYEGYQQ